MTRRHRPAPGSPDAAPGCVSCIGCLAWPIVHKHAATAVNEWQAYWSVGCGHCNGQTSIGTTRAAAVADWNDRNQRS